MDREHEHNVNLPIACTLTPAELAASRDGLLPGLLAKAQVKEAVPGGFRWRFDSHEGLLEEAAAVIAAEHRCCRFLRFLLIVEPDEGPVWLEVTGPDGTQEYLSRLLEAPPAESERRSV
jgi:hypothetical protein